jgi:microcystin-dependent protein
MYIIKLYQSDPVGPNEPSPLPVGHVQDYGGEQCPAGWLPCHGQSLSRTHYPELFAVLGTRYGQGTTPGETFSLPDFKLATEEVSASGYATVSGGNDPTEGTLAELAQRMYDAVRAKRAAQDLIDQLQIAIADAMEDDLVQLPHLPPLVRVPRKSTSWIDKDHATKFRDDTLDAIAREVARDNATGDLDPIKRNIARATLDIVTEALPAFSKLKVAGEKRLGIDPSAYRVTSESFVAKFEEEDEEG